jgi:molecular chaperone HscB
MDYFAFYDLPVAFRIDEKLLRARFLEKSKLLHPDLVNQTDDAAREEAEAMTALNNQAYQTLSNTDARIQYILELTGALGEEGTHKMSSDFLVEVMDINEALMELEFDFNPGRFEATQSSVQQLERELNDAVRPELIAFDTGQDIDRSLVRIRDYYFKKKYLLRIKENLSKFAAA